MSKVIAQEPSDPALGAAENAAGGDQSALYARASAEYSIALTRLAAAYESNPQRRQDLLQDIHFKLWRSFEKFEGGCSLRTWVYRVAHNTAATYVLKEQRYRFHALHNLEDLENVPCETDDERTLDQQHLMERMHALIRTLKPLDRQIVLLYLDGFSASDMAAVTGVTAGNIGTKLHRFKNHLKSHFNVGVLS